MNEIVDMLIYLNKGNHLPLSISYSMIRNLFEIHLTAHYISLKPETRVERYISYESIAEYNKVKGLEELKNSSKECYKKIAEEILSQIDIHSINQEYESIKSRYPRKDNWSGISIREMAKYTDHEEDYIYYYKFLCGFTHGNIKANLKYIHNEKKEVIIANRTNDIERGHIFNMVSQFYACFIDLLGNEFNYSLTEEIKKCWDFEGDNNN